jgi:hypothetical protein
MPFSDHIFMAFSPFLSQSRSSFLVHLRGLSAESALVVSTSAAFFINPMDYSAIPFLAPLKVET